MKHYKRIVSLTAAALLAVSAPVQALAASPEFARDEATWARLRDNVMEYDELPMLVEEYNPSYLNNLASYRDGKSSDDARAVQDKQYESAESIYDNAEALEDQADALMDSGALALPGMASAYAGLLTAAVMTEQTALTTEQAADASYRDSEMDTLDYRNTQNGLIVQTQALFASYHQVKKSLATIEKNIEILELTVGTVERQKELGMVTQVDYLGAKKNLASLQSTYIQTQASLETIRQNLCLMTGWKYNDQPEIQEMPAADESRIAEMNLDVDIQTALDANLSLQSNRKGYKNMAEGSADKKNMERTIKNQEETIKANMKNMYNDILQKQIALQLAQAVLETAKTTMNASNTKFQLGMLSKTELLSVEAAYLGKQVDMENANINLQQAIETYEWALKGYMN